MSDTPLTSEARADMRIEIVKREINQGALAGPSSAIGDYAARLIIAALDSFDEHIEQEAYARGFTQGIAFQRARAAAQEDGDQACDACGGLFTHDPQCGYLADSDRDGTEGRQ